MSARDAAQFAPRAPLPAGMLRFGMSCFCFEFDVMPNHALQRTAASRLGFNRAVSWPPSLSLGRCCCSANNDVPHERPLHEAADVALAVLREWVSGADYCDFHVAFASIAIDRAPEARRAFRVETDMERIKRGWDGERLLVRDFDLVFVDRMHKKLDHGPQRTPVSVTGLV